MRGIPIASMILALFAVSVVMLIVECEARASPLEDAIGRLQAKLAPAERTMWATAITRATTPHDLDPYLVAAMIMRESSFRADVADGTRRGTRGEVGPLQVHGAALKGVTCTGARCWLEAGVRWLVYQRERCPGSTWRWVAAYGVKVCPSETRARTMHSTRQAWRWYQVARPGVTSW